MIVVEVSLAASVVLPAVLVLVVVVEGIPLFKSLRGALSMSGLVSVMVVVLPLPVIVASVCTTKGGDWYY